MAEDRDRGGIRARRPVFVQSFLTHRYVIDNLLVDHLTGEAGHYVSAIERGARERRVAAPSQLRTLLAETQRENNYKINVLQAEWGRTLHDLQSSLLHRATTFTAGKGFDDDVTVVAAQVK